MKKILLFVSFLLINGITFGQTTATDFTATDCNSASQSLFTELNAGKIVVLIWVMPCSVCISDAKDKISINYNLNETSIVSIDIFNIIGNKVQTNIPGKQTAGAHSFDINFYNKLPNGIYFVKLNTGNKSQVVKFNIAN